MADLPIILPAGIVAVYGSCQDSTSPLGIKMPPNYRFGTIYNIWDGGGAYSSVGDTIMFREEDVYQRIVTEENLTYTLLPARLVTTDSPLL